MIFDRDARCPGVRDELHRSPDPARFSWVAAFGVDVQGHGRRRNDGFDMSEQLVAANVLIRATE
jgi:hypothetical protein